MDKMSTPEHFVHRDHLQRLQQLLAADTVPIRDGAGIIIPQGVDAHHRAAAYRRAISALTDNTNEVILWPKQQ